MKLFAVQTDVIIIGGGIAGLAAAKKLSGKGKNVVVLEASERFGGRVHTVYDPAFDTLLETGAEFIHGNLPITIGLLKEAGIPYYKTGGEQLYNENGKWRRSDEPSGWDRMLKKMKSLGKDMPLSDFLEQYFPDKKEDDLKRNVRHYAEGFDLADCNIASTFALRNEWLKEEEVIYRIKGGYSRLSNYLVNKCRQNGAVLHNNCIVKNIEWKKNEVKIYTVDGTVFTGIKALITVPIKMLKINADQKSEISFTPGIAAHTSAAEKIGYGTVIKIFFQFEEAFWLKHSADTGFIISNQVIPTWWTQLPYASKMLTGWLGGPPAKALRDADDKILTRLGLESLSHIFNIDTGKLRSLLQASRIIDWTAMPHIGGGYSFATVETINARKTLQAAIDETLFFSGEAIYESDSPGTVEAALHAGIIAGDSILKAN